MNYRSAGTVELSTTARRSASISSEVNTRLQVEHGVTGEVWGVDLVRWMIATGGRGFTAAERALPGYSPGAYHSGANLRPSWPPVSAFARTVNRRLVSAGGRRYPAHRPLGGAGSEIPPFCDPLLAKAIVWRPSRDEAIDGLAQALAETRLYDVETSRDVPAANHGFAPFHRR